MQKQNVKVTEFDLQRLNTLLVTAKTPGCSLENQLDQLQLLLANAEIVAPENIPSDVVTMNSTVRVKDYRSNAEMILSVVFPTSADDSDFDNVKVSILSPVGFSVFGRRVGDMISGKIKVEEILYQPEAAGDFDI